MPGTVEPGTVEHQSSRQPSSARRLNAIEQIEQRYSKRKRHSMETCSGGEHCTGEAWCTVRMCQEDMSDVNDISRCVETCFPMEMSYEYVTDRCLRDASIDFQVMVAETEYGLVEGIQMLEHSMNDNLVALDLEWRPDWQGVCNPVALMQLATPTACLIIRTRNFRKGRTLPWALESFLSDDDKLFDTFGVGAEVFGDLLDVQAVAKDFGYARPGLANMAQLLLGYTMDKSKSVTRSNWDAYTLSCRQLRYAAMDAVVTMALFRKLRAMHADPSTCEGCNSMLGVRPPSRELGPACNQCGRHTPSLEAPSSSSGSRRRKKKHASSEPQVSLVYYDQDFEDDGY